MPPILAFEKISKRFGAVVVADGIDLLLAEGEALGIIGPNGAGKTTLFGIASGTVRPDAGRVIFAGTDITHLAPERRCRMGIGRSFQIPQPFNGMTVFENLVVAAAFGGGHRERECAALVDLIRNIRRIGISIIWIEHIVHALIAVVDRLLVLYGGGFIGEGAPQAVIASPAVREIYMGIPTDA